MMDSYRHDKNCKVTQEKNGKAVDAEVIFFKHQDKMTVIINNTIKLPMTWNGRIYEGRSAGMDFVSQGPEVHKMVDHSKGRFHRQEIYEKIY